MTRISYHTFAMSVVDALTRRIAKDEAGSPHPLGVDESGVLCPCFGLTITI